MAHIKTITPLSPSIKRIVLAANTAGGLPAAAPGAHIIVTIAGANRVWKNAYSLISPSQSDDYTIIVRRVAQSRGGSAWLHAHAEIGQSLEISDPINLFPIARQAEKHLLISAGIGITPFLSYIKILQTSMAAFELHHCCKLDEAPAFAALLPTSSQITLHTSRNSLNLSVILAAQNLNTHLYICGPEGFMDMVLATARQLGWPEAKLHTESFGGATGGAPFNVRLARSGLTLHVGAEQTLLEALEAAGIAAPCLCRGGACGACELPVLEGVPEHHDHFLKPAQHLANNTIMTCVSRAKTPELVLDF